MNECLHNLAVRLCRLPVCRKVVFCVCVTDDESFSVSILGMRVGCAASTHRENERNASPSKEGKRGEREGGHANGSAKPDSITRDDDDTSVPTRRCFGAPDHDQRRVDWCLFVTPCTHPYAHRITSKCVLLLSLCACW